MVSYMMVSCTLELVYYSSAKGNEVKKIILQIILIITLVCSISPSAFAGKEENKDDIPVVYISNPQSNDAK